ncbi:hypothetical protein [Dictyobacter aurantiacus]|uniref:Uncharacterized protein n=1 Tax=Dictyobacter aurantiacus TaxID=1936993 RepID=A0A401ZAU9_9CHLR|nr:hypothetical protein [Dictyobacter aurantiacus]GCE03936.1 hypothetical protein KDAU_12650 [Dictyobacter aurantiacus]
MRYEKLNDISTLVVESSDERTSVVNWLFHHLGQYYRQPIVVVLPQDAVFRRPGDLRELQQVATRQDAQLVLVIEGNERLRLWARRHGFTVFSTIETCQKALLQPGFPPSWPSMFDGLPAQPELSTVIEQSPVTSFTGPWNRYDSHATGTQGETYRTSLSSSVAVADLREPSGQFGSSETLEMLDTAPVVAVRRITATRVTEPLSDLPSYGSFQGGERVRKTRVLSPAELLEKEEEAPFLSGVEFSLNIATQDMQAPEKMVQPVAEVAYAPEVLEQPSSFSTHVARLKQDKLLLILVALVVLGIVGGVGFGYLLEVARANPALQTPASLLHTIWGI